MAPAVSGWRRPHVEANGAAACRSLLTRDVLAVGSVPERAVISHESRTLWEEVGVWIDVRTRWLIRYADAVAAAVESVLRAAISGRLLPPREPLG